jgi:hypothetical protein
VADICLHRLKALTVAKWSDLCPVGSSGGEEELLGKLKDECDETMSFHGDLMPKAATIVRIGSTQSSSAANIRI